MPPEELLELDELELLLEEELDELLDEELELLLDELELLLDELDPRATLTGELTTLLPSARLIITA